MKFRIIGCLITLLACVLSCISLSKQYRKEEDCNDGNSFKIFQYLLVYGIIGYVAIYAITCLFVEPEQNFLSIFNFIAP